MENAEALKYTKPMKSIPEDLKIALGQCFWIGLNGISTRDSDTREIFRTFQPGGVILFQRNVDTIPQVRKMNADLQRLSSIPLFTAIDQEGGSVERLHEIIGTIPPAMVFSAARDIPAMRRIHGAHARILRDLGFNVNFTPVLDLAVTKADNGLGTRCFSDDPRTVIKYAYPLIRAFLDEGVLVCGKHFPGLGDTNLDSHLDLPTVPRPWSRVQSEDLLPYSALLQELPFIMVNHALYPDMNPRFPASLAPQIVSDFLLHKWNYPGLVISDDLIMGAVSRFYNVTEAAERALLAGNHLFLICKPDGVVRAYRELLQLAQSNASLQQNIHRAAGRILAFKFRRLAAPSRKTNLNQDREILEREAERVSAKAITLLAGKLPATMPSRLSMFLPRTKWLKHGHSGLPAELSRYGCRAREQYFDIAMSEPAARRLASGSTTEWNLVVTTSLSGRKGQQALVQKLMDSQKRVIVINGFFPHDLTPAGAAVILAAYWTSPAALRATAGVLAGKTKPSGRIPLHTY